MGLEVVDQLMSARFKIRKKGTVELDHRQTEWYKDRRFRAWVSLIQRADLSDDLHRRWSVGSSANSLRDR